MAIIAGAGAILRSIRLTWPGLTALGRGAALGGSSNMSSTGTITTTAVDGHYNSSSDVKMDSNNTTIATTTGLAE